MIKFIYEEVAAILNSNLKYVSWVGQVYSPKINSNYFQCAAIQSCKSYFKLQLIALPNSNSNIALCECYGSYSIHKPLDCARKEKALNLSCPI